MPKKLVIGLGNPGPEFEQTWHNLGFRAIRLLAGELKISMRWSGTEALIGRGRYAGQDVYLLLPQTYMNRSGVPVERLARRRRIYSDEVLVVLDDHDLPRGLLRLRESGGDGGHRGLRSILFELGTPDVARLRVGIRDENEDPVAGGYDDLAERVLQPLSERELEHLDAMAAGASRAVLDWIGGGMIRAMSRNNNRRIEPPGSGKSKGADKKEDSKRTEEELDSPGVE